MSDERPDYCTACGAPMVWCMCPDDCQKCGKKPTVTIYPNGRAVISCYHDGAPSRVVAGVDLATAVSGWNGRAGVE